MINTHIITMHQSAKHMAKNQKELMLSVFLKAAADSFVTVYVPVYLLTHGVRLQAVMLYCAIVFGSTFIFLQFALKACQYVGAKKILTLGILINVLFYYLLHSAIISQQFVTIAVVDGAALGFYFGAYNMLLTRAMVRSREGRGYTLQQLSGMLAGVLGPLIGSLVIKQLSFQNLFLGVIAILVAAPIPLFFSKEVRTKRESLWLGNLLIANRSQRRIDRAVFLQGILYGAGTIWPLYVYIHYPHILALGVLTSVSAGLVLLFTYLIGNSVDKHQRMAYGLGSLIYAPTWLTRLLFITPLGLTMNAFGASILGIAPTMAVAKDIFHTAKLSKNRSAHFARIEFYMDAGRVSIFVVTFLTVNLTAMFLISSAAALLYLACRPKPSNQQPVRTLLNA